MDAKITKDRLSRMLSYDWIKIIALALGAIFFWNLIFTVTATRILPSQQFVVINYLGNNPLDDLSFLSDVAKEDVFSQEVLEISQVDAPFAGSSGGILLEARLATNEGDAIFVPPTEDPNAAYEQDGETHYETYREKLLRLYGYILYDLDPNSETGYFKSMEKYLNQYYGGDWENGALNEDAVEKDFRDRIAENKDKRFRKKDEIEQGVRDEIARIQKYRDGLEEFYGYFAQGLVKFEKETAHNLVDGSVLFEGTYYLNICPDTNTMGRLKEAFSYSVEMENGTDWLKTAENMCVAFIRFEDEGTHAEYENLLFVNYLISRYKTV